MTAYSATIMERTQETEGTRKKGEEIVSQFSDTYDLIARRAFELFERRGAIPGHDKEDWLRAESELLHPLPLSLIESIGGYIVYAEVPGFRKRDLEIHLEPRRLVISGLRDTKLRKSGQALCSETGANRILRSVELPSTVDTQRVITTIEDGMLTVELPKSLDAD